MRASTPYTKIDRASNSVQLWCICAVFFLLFGLLVAEHYTKIDRASNSVQLWRICAVFFLFLACFCPKPNGELGCCSLPANDGLLMIDTPEFIRICSLTYETQGEGTRVELAPPLRGL